jgi:heme o synthase
MSFSTSKLNIPKDTDKESSVSDYISLLKPRVMALAIFTSICGLYLAPGNLHPFLSLTAIICISIGAGASGAINMWYDRDIDGKMERTKKRAIPMGKIDPANVLGFGVILAVISVLVLGLTINYFAAFLLASSIAFYIFIYTVWLKRRTHHNIVIGGAAGAFPPVIGWSCVTGDISVLPLMLFLIIFVWTPPHFWALAMYKDVEYSKVNIPMLPVVHGRKVAKIQSFIYSLVLCLVSVAPFFIGLTGKVYLFSSLFLNSIFIFYSFKLLNSDKNENDIFASRLFKFSILYLYLIFMFFILDKIFQI